MSIFSICQNLILNNDLKCDLLLANWLLFNFSPSLRFTYFTFIQHIEVNSMTIAFGARHLFLKVFFVSCSIPQLNVRLPIDMNVEVFFYVNFHGLCAKTCHRHLECVFVCVRAEEGDFACQHDVCHHQSSITFVYRLPF